MGYQECKKCGNVLEKTNKFFNWDNKKKGTLKKYCKPCFHEISKGYRETFKIKKEKLREDLLFDIAEIGETEKAELFYKAFATIYFNAFDKSLFKEEYEKLKIVK